MERPTKHCYWVVPGKLLAGEYPGALESSVAEAKVKAFTEAGVGAFLDLTEERDGLRPYAKWIDSAVYQRFGIRDVSIPASKQVTLAILDAIDEHLAEGRMVYVHCWGGVGRAGIIVGCWLARHGLTGAEASERLEELWSHCPKSGWRKSPETRQQLDYIRSWEEPSLPLDQTLE